MDFEIRKSRKEQGLRELQREREREEYFQLMKLGFGNLEASRRVGVNPRTGREWRNGRPEGRKKRPRPLPNAMRVASGPSGTRRKTSGSTSPTGSGRKRRSGPSRRTGPQPVHSQPGDTPNRHAPAR